MGKLYFKAELLDDVVLSQKTATVGSHKSLDYIPGSVFLGVAASHFYSNAGENDWDIFHTSKVRFCNAYPLINGKRAVPMPLSFHSEKVGNDKVVKNFTCHEAKEDGIQYRQNRAGYVGFADEGTLSFVMPEKTSRMRTAIDPKTGTAAKSQLYGYESLDEGQVFVGIIEWDDSVQAAVAQIANLFESGTIIHAGRSKTASYGRIKVSKIDMPEAVAKADALNGSSFSILAVSDLCLRNPATGIPEMNVSPARLGLGNSWQLDKTRSFVRSSCLYQYNSYRREIEMQKDLILKGSVFTFKAEKDITPEEKEIVLSSICSGIGEYKGQGFGEITLLNVGNTFTKEELNSKASAVSQTLSPEEEEWLMWLALNILSKDAEEKVRNAIIEFVAICKGIKVFHALGNEYEFWPKNAQWGRILECLRQASTKEDLKKQLFEGDNTVIKSIKVSETEKNKDTKVYNPDPEWNYKPSPNGKTLRDWLKEFIEDSSMNDKDIKIALQELVKRCRDKIADKNWLKDGVK